MEGARHHGSTVSVASSRMLEAQGQCKYRTEYKQRILIADAKPWCEKVTLFSSVHGVHCARAHDRLFVVPLKLGPNAEVGVFGIYDPHPVPFRACDIKA